MARDTTFSDYVLEQLAGLRGASSRPMFSGFGLYRGGVMFGLIARGEFLPGSRLPTERALAPLLG